jgi:hypothetical protein
MRQVARVACLTLQIGAANADESEGFIAMPHPSFKNVFTPENVRRARLL